MAEESNNDKLKNESQKEENEEMQEETHHVDPWSVSGKVNYTKLCDEFGCDLVTPAMLEKLEKITGKRTHPMIRRGLYYAHREFDTILNLYEKGQPFYLYTGRGPSSESMHLGHMIPFIINKHLQDVFNVPLVIQVTDDEKFFWKDMSLEEATRLGKENIKDIIAMGFDITKTFIFLDTEYIQYLYPNVCKVQEKVTYNQMKSLFGFADSGVTCGKIAYPAIQAVPAFASTFKIPLRNRNMKCLIPCAIDQDPYFRMTRDVAPKINEHKCTTLYSKFIPGLRGPKGKMSASVDTSAIYLNDSPKTIRNKIKKYAYSGGQVSKELHMKLGANLDEDVAYQYLTFFMEDDKELEEIGNKYKNGEIFSNDVKEKLCDVLIPIIQEFQENRKHVTDEMVQTFTAVRPLLF